MWTADTRPGTVAVSEEDWEEIQQQNAARNRSEGPTRCHSSENPASALLKCAVCGEAYDYPNMTLFWHDVLPYLLCARKKNLGPLACNNDNVRMDLAASVILAYLRDEARLYVNDAQGVKATAPDLRTCMKEASEGPEVRELIKTFVERADLYRRQENGTKLKPR